jgi:hypothetical protein
MKTLPRFLQTTILGGVFFFAPTTGPNSWSRAASPSAERHRLADGASAAGARLRPRQEQPAPGLAMTTTPSGLNRKFFK